MSIEKVRAYFRSKGMEDRVLEFPVSSATVELAAQAVGCEPARIAKTLSFMVKEQPILIVAAGDARIDNGRYKALFGAKAKMLTPDEAVTLIGHAVGGVCPCSKSRCGCVPGRIFEAFFHGFSGLRKQQQRH